MSTITQKNKHYLVKSTYGSYKFNNRKTAEQLNNILTDYENIKTQHTHTEIQLDHITKTIIQMRMTISILETELDKLMETTQCK